MNDAEVYAAVRMDLMRYATALVGVSDAGDVVSAVVTRTFGRRGGLAGLDDPKPYLMRAVLNEARMRHRSERRRERAVARLGSDEGAPEFDHVLDLVMALPPRQRAAIYLTYYERRNAVDVGELMGCRPATVRRYLYLAREKLRGALDD